MSREIRTRCPLGEIDPLHLWEQSLDDGRISLFSISGFWLGHQVHVETIGRLAGRLMVCPVCAGPMREGGSRRGIQLVRCECRFVCVDPSQWQYPFTEKDYYNAAETPSLKATPHFILNRVKGIRRHLGAGLVADLGSGFGETAIALAGAGFDAVGVDESQIAIDFLKRHYSRVEWHCGRIADYLDESDIHDGLLLYHVLEHIPEPKGLCRLMREKLKAGGLLVIEVPDVESGQARLYGERWGMYIPDHVNYFTTSTLAKLLEPLGFSFLRQERKYHFAWPTGTLWKDEIHRALSAVGLHSNITTYWTCR